MIDPAELLAAADYVKKIIADHSFGTASRTILIAAEPLADFAKLLLGKTPVSEETVRWSGWIKIRGTWRSPLSKPRGGPVCYIEWNPLLGCDGWSINGTELIGPFETLGELRAALFGLKIPTEPPQPSTNEPANTEA